MKLQPGLTKEGFFNGMEPKYPKALSEFRKWLDKYKDAVGWVPLFGETTRVDYTFSAPKYHDLPYGMQLGIFLIFVSTFEDNQDYVVEMFKDNTFSEELDGMIETFFAIREEEINNPVS